MVIASREHVVQRLKELRDWADYIVQSLSFDQAYERGKLELLKQMIASKELLNAREEAKGLSEHLGRLIQEAEPVSSPSKELPGGRASGK